MNSEDTNLSLQFYNYSCNLIGSDDVVRTRRDIFTVVEYADIVNHATYISSGSKAEGIDLKGSDYDQMVIVDSVRVYESLNDVQSASNNIILNMETYDTKPGFTKLKLVDKSNLVIDQINNWCETIGEVTYISNKRFREQQFGDGMIIHGPCLSTPGGEFDRAISFRCNEWITQAQQWIHRSRTAWPDYKPISSAVHSGVLFVPIGCKNSPNEDLQWRISFSVTEKMLIHFFSHTQLLCYALMKTILKDIIKPKHGELLCSYFLKTIMFWLSEEVSPSKWKPEVMISCFQDCVRRLIYFVKYKTCLHYFIPENNLFEDRFTDNEHKALLDTLQFIYGLPWTSVFDTKTFQNYRLESVNSHQMALTAAELTCFTYVNLLTNNAYFINSVFKRFVNGYDYIFKNEMRAFMICVWSRKSMQPSDVHTLTDRNKSFYKQYKRTLCHFKISLKRDSMSSWLLLASLFYKCKRFQECLDIINYSLSICTQEKIHLHMNNNLAEQTVFKEMKQRCGLLLAFKHLIIEDVCFRHPFCLFPDELIPLIDGKTLFIPPVVYSYLLQFLCCYQLGDFRGTRNALHDLELTINERYFIFSSEHFSEVVNTSLFIVKSLI